MIDTHVHFYDVAEKLSFDAKIVKQIFGSSTFLTSDHTKSEFEYTYKFCSKNKLKAYYSFGVHPQNPTTLELDFLESLLKEKKLHAIGEIGFDLYDDKNQATYNEQQKVWAEQINLAIEYDLPIVIHLRKATHLMFTEKDKLKKVKSVIFHGWPGSVNEANSILKLNINAYFSLGKALLRGKKTTLAMAKDFPLSRLLTETDAPYMTLKTESFSLPSDIVQVSKTLAFLRNTPLEAVLNQIQNNFFTSLFLKN